MTITVHSSKVIYDKAIEVNYELKLNGDEQQDDKKHWKDQWDIDNKS